MAPCCACHRCPRSACNPACRPGGRGGCQRSPTISSAEQGHWHGSRAEATYLGLGWPWITRPSCAERPARLRTTSCRGLLGERAHMLSKRRGWCSGTWRRANCCKGRLLTGATLFCHSADAFVKCCGRTATLQPGRKWRYNYRTWRPIGQICGSSGATGGKRWGASATVCPAPPVSIGSGARGAPGGTADAPRARRRSRAPDAVAPASPGGTSMPSLAHGRASSEETQS